MARYAFWYMWARIRWVLLMSLAALMLVLVLGRLTYELEYGSHQYVLHGEPLSGLSARAWSVFDIETGEVLAREGADDVYPIASLTKLMTAQVVLGQMDMTATATVSWRSVGTEGRAGRLSYGDHLTVRELLFPLLLESSNDAAETLAESMGRDSMVAAMNEYTRTLGMTLTHFDDPSGLSKDNRSTVADLERLIMHLWHNDRYLFDITRLPKYIGAEHTWVNSNLIAASDGFVGGKNGYTDEAQHTLVAVFDQLLQNREVRTLAVVLLQSEDVGEDVTHIREYLGRQVSYEYII